MKDLHLQVDPAMTVAESQQVAGNGRRVLRERFPRVADVLVHVEPGARRGGQAS